MVKSIKLEIHIEQIFELLVSSRTEGTFNLFFFKVKVEEKNQKFLVQTDFSFYRLFKRGSVKFTFHRENYKLQQTNIHGDRTTKGDFMLINYKFTHF